MVNQAGVRWPRFITGSGDVIVHEIVAFSFWFGKTMLIACRSQAHFSPKISHRFGNATTEPEY